MKSENSETKRKIAFILFLFIFGVASQCSAKTFRVKMYSSQTGKLMYDIKAEADSSILLPVPGKNEYNYVSYNFLGWDVVRGKIRGAKYLPGKPVKVTRNLRLYDVGFPTSKDHAKAPEAVPGKYKKVIIVGDSRMNGIRTAVIKYYGVQELRDVIFIIRTQHGFEWFNDVIGNYNSRSILSKIRIGAASELYFHLNQLNDDGDERPVAVIIAYGVGEARDIFGTVSEISGPVLRSVRYTSSVLSKLAEDLHDENVDLYYADIAPGNGSLSSYLSQEAVYRFNMLIKKRVPDYTVIDLWSRMYKSGFCYGKEMDGVHYSLKTSTRMYNILMSYLAAS